MRGLASEIETFFEAQPAAKRSELALSAFEVLKQAPLIILPRTRQESGVNPNWTFTYDYGDRMLRYAATEEKLGVLLKYGLPAQVAYDYVQDPKTKNELSVGWNRNLVDMILKATPKPAAEAKAAAQDKLNMLIAHGPDFGIEGTIYSEQAYLRRISNLVEEGAVLKGPVTVLTYKGKVRHVYESIEDIDFALNVEDMSPAEIRATGRNPHGVLATSDYFFYGGQNERVILEDHQALVKKGIPINTTNAAGQTAALELCQRERGDPGFGAKNVQMLTAAFKVMKGLGMNLDLPDPKGQTAASCLKQGVEMTYDLVLK